MNYPEPTWTVARVFHSETVDEYVPERMRALRETDPGSIKDLTFRGIAQFVQNLDDEQVRSLAAFARMIAVDSVAGVLGYIEGCSTADGLDDDFSLTYAGKDITPDILHAFLCVDDRSLEASAR
jgi:hypothetical protein